MTRIRFENSPSTNTPINAENLNKLNNVIVSSEEPTTGEEVWLQKGKNLFDTKLLVQGGWNNPVNSERVVWGIKVKAGITYTLTNYSSRRVSAFETSNLEQSSSSNSVLVEHGAIDGNGNLTFTTKNNAYLRLLFSNIDNGDISISDILSSNIQLEQGEVATPYEPYINKKIHTKNDNGYEEFYNEEEQLLKSSIIIETVTLPEITITSGTRTNTYKSVAKDGYKPLGIVSIDGTNDYVSMGKFLINPSNETAYVTVVNSNANSQTTKITLTVLYIKK